MEQEEKKGLGGWLILVGLGVVVTPVRLLFTHVPVYQPLFTDGVWDALTIVGSETYHPLWQPLLTGEIAFNLFLFAASLCLIYLFFSRHHRFPLAYIAVTVIALVFIPLDAWLCSFLLPGEPMFDAQTTREMVRAAISSLIWIPYMLLSRRVKATFVKGGASCRPTRAGVAGTNNCLVQ